MLGTTLDKFLEFLLRFYALGLKRFCFTGHAFKLNLKDFSRFSALGWKQICNAKHGLTLNIEICALVLCPSMEKLL